MFELKSVELIITTACPLKCPYCYVTQQQDYQAKSVPVDILLNRLNKVEEAGWLPNTALTIIGGEPLIHPYLEEIMDHVDEQYHRLNRKMRVTIITSGVFPAKQAPAIERLLKIPYIEWQVSFHKEQNLDAYYNFLLHLTEARVPNRPPYKTMVVVNTADEALEAFARLHDLLVKINNGKDVFPKGESTRLKKQLSRMFKRKDKIRQGASLYLRGKDRLVLGFFKSVNIGEARSDYRANQDRNGCSILICPENTNIIIDENGMIKPCASPRQRGSHPVLSESIDAMKTIPNREELFVSLVDLRNKLMREAMLSKFFNTLRPAESLQELFNCTKICEICEKLDRDS